MIIIRYDKKNDMLESIIVNIYLKFHCTSFKANYEWIKTSVFLLQSGCVNFLITYMFQINIVYF